MGARGEALARARVIRTRRVEAIALGVLALLPIVPHLTALLRTGVPRYGLFGEHALLEQATRHVWSGDTLLGSRSRFQWNHPGPLFFYLAAPFQALFGSASTGLYVGTCIINAASAGGLTACTRLFARRAHGVAALLIVLTWFVAFGNVAANPWPPLVVVLPLMAFLVNGAMLARGKSAALLPTAIFGTLAGQTHIAVAPTTLVVGLVALIAFFVGARRRGGLDSIEHGRLAVAAAVVFLMFVPTFVEQLVAKTGNLHKIYDFFVHREAPLARLATATTQWTSATTWLPQRAVTRALVDEGAIPLVMRADALPREVGTNARVVAIVHVLSVAIAALIAARRRDVASLALLGVGALADAIAVVSLQAVVGASTHYLLFWTTAASTVAWIGVLGAAFSIIEALALRAPRVTAFIAPALVLVGLSAAVVATSLQRFWLAKHPAAPSSRPELRADLRALEAALRQRLERDGTTVVVHREGATEVADALVLELEKDAVDVHVASADASAFVGVRPEAGVAKPLHAWLATTAQPLRKACADDRRELVAMSGGLALFGSTTAPACAAAK
jgi:hypothetical protein